MPMWWIYYEHYNEGICTGSNYQELAKIYVIWYYTNKNMSIAAALTAAATILNSIGTNYINVTLINVWQPVNSSQWSRDNWHTTHVNHSSSKWSLGLPSLAADMNGCTNAVAAKSEQEEISGHWMYKETQCFSAFSCHSSKSQVQWNNGHLQPTITRSNKAQPHLNHNVMLNEPRHVHRWMTSWPEPVQEYMGKHETKWSLSPTHDTSENIVI